MFVHQFNEATHLADVEYFAGTTSPVSHGASPCVVVSWLYRHFTRR
jgi:hypothetical protein